MKFIICKIVLVDSETAHCIETYKVPEAINERVRLSDFLPGIFQTITSKNGLKNAIKKGLVRVNGKIGFTSDYIFGGEVIELHKEQKASTKPTIDLKLEILFEDEFLALINKPAGVVVSGNKRWTIENALPNNLQPSSQTDALERPEPIHRLDMPTSGVLLVGKTIESIRLLNKMFEERLIEKIYMAITCGEMELSGIIDKPVDGKLAKSKYRIVNSTVSEKYKYLNLIELKPFTGRKHQLRIHMSQNGNPILGDKFYGAIGGTGLYLHALSLKFKHPITGVEVFYNAALPLKYTRIFKNSL